MPRRRRYRARKVIKRYVPRSLYRMGRTVQYLKKVINVEYKTSIDAGTITPSATGDIRLMCDVAQGDAKGERDGMSVKWQHCTMKGFIQKNASATHTQTRILLIQDRQPNGALPVMNDILDAFGAGTAMLRPLNVDNGYRFKVLAQRIITVDANSTMKSFKWYKKIPFHTKYSGATANIGDIRSNSIIMLSVSSETTNTPTISYNMQSRYTDN